MVLSVPDPLPIQGLRYIVSGEICQQEPVDSSMENHLSSTIASDPQGSALVHPPALEAIDGPYFVPWGRNELRRLFLRTAILLATILVIATYSELPGLMVLAVPVLLFAAIGVLFFRNPRRRSPSDPSVLVSPADGKVVDVRRVEEGEFLDGPALQVGIFLSIFDVHVNRAPGNCTVEFLRYRPGAFHDARDEKCSRENESQSIGMRLSTVAGIPGDPVLVRQISGAIARRIICPLEPGNTLVQGGLVGMIKYGSRTEIFVPLRPGAASNWEATVRPGDRVRGGESVVFKRASR